MNGENVLNPVTSFFIQGLAISPLFSFTKNFKSLLSSSFFLLKNFVISADIVGGLAKLIAILGANKVSIKTDCAAESSGRLVVYANVLKVYFICLYVESFH